MRRRACLRALVGAGAGLLSGCAALGSGRTEEPTGTPTTTAMGTPTAPADMGEAFELVSLNAPEQIELKIPWTFSFQVRNVTSEPQLFRTTLSTRSDDESEWEAFQGHIQLAVPPGEVRGWKSPRGQFRYLKRVEYRLDAIGETWAVESVPKTVDFAVSYTTPDGLVMNVEGVSFQSERPGGTTNGTTTTTNGTTTRTATDGEQWALFPLTVRNRADGSRSTPDAAEFELDLGDETRRPTPLDGDRVYRATELAAGGTTEGVVPYRVPADTTDNDVRVWWRRSYDAGDVAIGWDK